MGYVIAAYAVGVGGVVIYLALLLRERRRLRQALSQDSQPNRG